MKQRQLVDTYGKTFLITTYMDGAATLYVGGKTVDFAPGHALAPVLNALVSHPVVLRNMAKELLKK